MLTLEIGGNEYYDYSTETFGCTPVRDVTFYHSLSAIAKWEARFEKPFLAQKDITLEEIRYYIMKCMTNEHILQIDLSKDIMNAIQDYMVRDMTATKFIELSQNGPGANKTMTAEILYAYMVVGNIPFETQDWHINRLIALIRVIADITDTKKKKIPKSELMARNRALNEQRKKAMNTKG